MTGRVIAIDGPAASGKSSTAAAVAAALGFVHVDSGALYRALTWLALRHDVTDPEDIVRLAGEARIALHPVGGDLRVQADGFPDLEPEIRTAAVNARVSDVAAMPAVRDWVNHQIRTASRGISGAVIDGRDIGTVVVPDAGLKIYLTATPQARAERRLRQAGVYDSGLLAAEVAELQQRDHRDATRAVAPLRQADDAILVDTTALSFAEQVAVIVDRARRLGW